MPDRGRDWLPGKPGLLPGVVERDLGLVELFQGGESSQDRLYGGRDQPQLPELALFDLQSFDRILLYHIEISFLIPFIIENFGFK